MSLIKATVLDSGCCGLAGFFGYEREHHDVSMRIGERVLLPEVRKASADTVVIADGFSCRQQIAHGSNRRAMHVAEVLQMVLNSPREPLADRKKRRRFEEGRVPPEPRLPVFGLLLGLGTLAGASYLLARGNRNR